MALLTVVTASTAGANVTGVTPTTGTGDTWTNTGAEFLVYRNGSGAPITVTLDIIATVDGQSVTDRSVSIPAGEMRVIGPFNTAIYTDPATGYAKATPSASTTVTVAVVKMAKG